MASLVGLIVLIMLPDQDRHGSVRRMQIVKLVSLASLVVGFVLALLGAWMHDVLIVLGAIIVVVSLPFLVGDGRG